MVVRTNELKINSNFDTMEKYMIVERVNLFFENLPDIVIVKRFIPDKIDSFESAHKQLHKCFSKYHEIIDHFIGIIPHYKNHLIRVCSNLDGQQESMIASIIDDFSSTYNIVYDIVNMKVSNKFLYESDKLFVDINDKLQNSKLVFFDQIYKQFKDCMLYSASNTFDQEHLKEVVLKRYQTLA